MLDTDCLMLVYFHVVSASASATAQSPSITHTFPPPTGEHALQLVYSCWFYNVDVCAGTDTVSQFQFLEAVGSKIPAKWRKVGMSLGISSGSLDGIERHRRGDCFECFSDVFTYWQQQSTPQSPADWATLVTVLRSVFVDEKELSETIQNIFM